MNEYISQRTIHQQLLGHSLVFGKNYHRRLVEFADQVWSQGGSAPQKSTILHVGAILYPGLFVGGGTEEL